MGKLELGMVVRPWNLILILKVMLALKVVMHVHSASYLDNLLDFQCGIKHCDNFFYM